ncbi:MAG: hypothetical protein EOO75_05095 [Myxococcales bacterium]|nr:MAG: hypothetical protein EOO75_05095 [Myxococcales bacterium]
MRTPGLLVLTALLAAGCGKSSYKVIEVPYCQVPEGQENQGFAGAMRYIYSAGSSSGTGPLGGQRPTIGLGTLDAVERDAMVLAIISCPPVGGGNRVTTVSSDPAKLAREFTAAAVPALCPMQKVLYHGTLKASDDATARERGYNGVLRFPEIASLTCPVGTLRRTSSSDIEPRPR